ILSRGPEITERDIVLSEVREQRPPRDAFVWVPARAEGSPPSLDEVERAYLVRLLEHFEGHRSAAAQAMGVSYPTFLRRLRDFGHSSFATLSSVNDRAPITHDLGARRVVRALVASQIREVANAGMGEPDILPFWFGEPDEVTPEYIRNAAVASIAAGETFYTPNLGLPELREAIAGYVTWLRRPVAAGNVAVNSSGMNAL